MSAFIYEKSSHCTLNQQGLFSLKPTQASVEASNYTKFLPVATLTMKVRSNFTFLLLIRFT